MRNDSANDYEKRIYKELGDLKEKHQHEMEMGK
jgi:hypothetical protein